MSASTLLPLLLLHAVTVDPASFPAKGRHEAVVRVDTPSMIRLAAEDPSGTACELVDHLRGPFASFGVPGKESCRLDLLLDAGVYKVRLEGAPKARGQVKLTAAPFTELNRTPVKLTPGSEARLDLRPGQQASYWVRVTQRGPIAFRASGRTAGALHIWRDGQWLEELGATRHENELEPGQPIHEWWVERVMEPGDYRFTVYGTDEARWTRGKPHDVLSVSLGFPDAPEGRSLELTLPPWGFAALSLPKHRTVALLSMERAGAQATSLGLFPLDGNGGTSVSSDSAAGSCSIQPKALLPECAAYSGSDARHVLMVRGAPGTKVSLQWAPQLNEARATSGDYAPGARTVFAFTPPSTGEYLLALHDVPVDADAPPLSCVVERAQLPAASTGAPVLPDWTTTWSVVTRDELLVSRTQPFRRAFNHDGNESRIAFRIGGSGTYRVLSSGDRDSRCELWANVSGKRQRLSSTEVKPGPCDLRTQLDAGSYELVLYQGTPGIERVRIATEDAIEGPDTPGKTSCRFDRLQLDDTGHYRLTASRGGAIAARGFFLERGPISLNQPVSLVVEARGRVALRLSGRQEVRARSVGAGLRCTWNGEPVAGCAFSTGQATSTLELTNTGDTSLPVTILRPAAQAVVASPSAHHPEQVKLRTIQPGDPVHLDFDRGEQHSLRFQVDAPGLYDVTTTGLLSTACDIRTAVVTALASNSSGGRGRNCLVAQYLRPGQYLLSVRTLGQSRGRAGIVVERRPVRVLDPLVADDQAFFRAEAAELIQQAVQTRRAGDHRLATTAPGATLQCRLEDDEGWPIVRVPTDCEGTFPLSRGKFLWTQLPLTVESMRRTQIERVRGAVVLRGEKEHKIALNIPYPAQLGDDGRDAFVFTLPAELDLRVTLTNGMQGRVYRLGEGAPKAVELIPPTESSSSVRPELPQTDEESEGEPEAESEPEAEAEPEPESGEGAEAQVTVPGALPSGHRIHLPAGRYRIVAEHSRADVGIAYFLQISTDTLVPGTGLDVQAPTRLPLHLAKAGTLRLQTEGGTDVRCRVLDATGRMLFESTSHGADWNCALAEPFDAGEYTVVIESETQRPGPTRISAALLEVKIAGMLPTDRPVVLGASTQVFELPEAGEDVVRDLNLRSSERFSCALEAPDGALIFRRTEVKECAVLARLAQGRPRLRLWTLSRSASVTARHLLRPIQPLQGERIPAGAAARAEIARPGQYRTSGAIHCLPEDLRGVLIPCRDEVSLEPGGVVFSAFGTTDAAPLPLSEIVSTVEPLAPPVERPMGARPFIQRVRSETKAVHVLEVRVPMGEPATVSCALEGGVRTLGETRCAAATARTDASVVRWSMPVEAPVAAGVQLGTLSWPEKAHSLAAGVHTLTWTGTSVRLALPERPSRVDLLVPPGAWVVQLDRSGVARDLCAPEPSLSRCVFSGNGGEVLLHASSDSRAEARVTLLDAPERTERLAGLFESDPRVSGRIRFQILANSTARRLEVLGAERCVLTLSDGRRFTGCTLDVPAQATGELVVDHGATPFRALLHAPGQRDETLFAMPRVTDAKPLTDATALRLPGAIVARTLTLGERAAVHLHSDAGVCGVWPAAGGALIAADGLGTGCDLDRVLSPGTYLVAIRAFAGIPPAGEFTWNRTPIEVLHEGVNDERWIAAGPSRFFRFEVVSEGRIGLGLQLPAEALSCTLYDAMHTPLAEGCQQYLSVPAGEYLLEVRPPASGAALPFRPVLFGLSGSRVDVPEDYLRDFFQRIGVSR